MRFSVKKENRHYREINFRTCGWEACRPGWSYGPGARDHWLIHFVVSGKGRFYSHGVWNNLQASDMFVIRPGEKIYYEADQREPWTYIWIGYDDGCHLSDQLSEDVWHVPQYYPLFISLKRAAEMESGQTDYLIGKIWELHSMIRRDVQNLNPQGKYVRQAKNWIEAEYMTGLTVNELAERLKLGRSYFSGVFSREVGMPPQEYLKTVRMEKAAELLAGSNMTVSEVATSVGYQDVFAFSRMFKKHYGISPGKMKGSWR